MLAMRDVHYTIHHHQRKFIVHMCETSLRRDLFDGFEIRKMIVNQTRYAADVCVLLLE